MYYNSEEVPEGPQGLAINFCWQPLLLVLNFLCISTCYDLIIPIHYWHGNFWEIPYLSNVVSIALKLLQILHG